MVVIVTSPGDLLIELLCTIMHRMHGSIALDAWALADRHITLAVRGWRRLRQHVLTQHQRVRVCAHTLLHPVCW